MSLTNLQIADLLARSADQAESYRQRAYRKASRSALAWAEEARDVLDEGRRLTELAGVGDKLARRIEGWMNQAPEVGDPPESRTGFSTRSVSSTIVEGHPEWREDINADLQMHTTYSDGTVSIEGMAEAARALGYSYVAITDHSQGLKVAGGMTPDEMRMQAREIAEVNDALSDSGFRVLGHPRGRMYGTRAGLYANWKKVFAEAAKVGKAVEIDCNPNRQDLNAELAARAVDAGCYISIGTDSHYIHELDYMDMGIATALAAGAPRERILNYMSADELLAWVADR